MISTSCEMRGSMFRRCDLLCRSARQRPVVVRARALLPGGIRRKKVEHGADGESRGVRHGEATE